LSVFALRWMTAPSARSAASMTRTARAQSASSGSTSGRRRTAGKPWIAVDADGYGVSLGFAEQAECPLFPRVRSRERGDKFYVTGIPERVAEGRVRGPAAPPPSPPPPLPRRGEGRKACRPAGGRHALHRHHPPPVPVFGVRAGADRQRICLTADSMVPATAKGKAAKGQRVIKESWHNGNQG